TAPCGRPTACDRGSGSAAAPSATAALHVATTRQGLSTAVAHPCAQPAILDDHLHETTTRVIILLGPLSVLRTQDCVDRLAEFLLRRDPGCDPDALSSSTRLHHKWNPELNTLLEGLLTLSRAEVRAIGDGKARHLQHVPSQSLVRGYGETGDTRAARPGLVEPD